MICAYRQCGRAFEPRRRNQVYCQPRCRERAKNLRHLVIRVSPAERKSVERARVRRKCRVTPLVSPEQSLSRLIFQQAALWLAIQQLVIG